MKGLGSVNQPGGVVEEEGGVAGQGSHGVEVGLRLLLRASERSAVRMPARLQAHERNCGSGDIDGTALLRTVQHEAALHGVPRAVHGPHAVRQPRIEQLTEQGA